MQKEEAESGLVLILTLLVVVPSAIAVFLSLLLMKNEQETIRRHYDALYTPFVESSSRMIRERLNRISTKLQEELPPALQSDDRLCQAFAMADLRVMFPEMLSVIVLRNNEVLYPPPAESLPHFSEKIVSLFNRVRRGERRFREELESVKALSPHETATVLVLKMKLLSVEKRPNIKKLKAIHEEVGLKYTGERLPDGSYAKVESDLILAETLCGLQGGRETLRAIADSAESVAIYSALAPASVVEECIKRLRALISTGSLRSQFSQVERFIAIAERTLISRRLGGTLAKLLPSVEGDVLTREGKLLLRFFRREDASGWWEVNVPYLWEIAVVRSAKRLNLEGKVDFFLSGTGILAGVRRGWVVCERKVIDELKLGASVEEPYSIDRSALLRTTFFGWLAVLACLIASAGSWVVVSRVRRTLRVSALRADLLSAVSHELKTPLTSIRIFAEGLLDSNDPDERQSAQVILRETDRLERLINNILNVLRAERGAFYIHPSEGDLGETVRQVVEAVRWEVEERNGKLELILQPDLRPIPYDADAISGAVWNLISNAIKFSDGAPEVTVKVQEKNGFQIITVSDKGVGIEPDELKKIFKKFYRGSGAQKLRAGGSGLGLTLVHHIVTAHNGRVEIDSNPGEYSTFSILLPMENDNSSDNRG